MYSSLYGSSSSSIVKLPANMPIGAVIGKSGQNIKTLAQRSGARLTVTVGSSGGEVTISGSPSAIQAAEKLLNLQIQAFLASGGAYPHPLRVIYLLGSSYGINANNKVLFRRRQDGVADAANRREPLYQLQPASPHRCQSTGQHSLRLASGLEGLTSAFGGMQVTGKSSAVVHDNCISLLLENESPTAVQQVLDAAEKAMKHKPSFDVVKFKFNFGKGFWYNSHSGSLSLHEGLTWSVKDMREKEIPHDLKSVYSNGVAQQHVTRLKQWLTHQGFSQVEVKERVSVHLVHQEANAAYTLSFDKDRHVGLKLRKISTGTIKPCFLTLLSDGNEPDWRGKLLAKYSLKQGTPVHRQLSSLAGTARMSSTRSIHFQNLSAHDMTVDKERHKYKVVYFGSFPSTSSIESDSPTRASIASSSNSSSDAQIKLTITQLDGPCGGSFEVSGTSPQINEILVDRLQGGSGLKAADIETLRRLIHHMLCFASAAVVAMGK